MKLVFKKDEENHISVLTKVGELEKEFSYIDMVKSLIDTRKMEEPEILDGFSEAEVASINRMITLINKKVAIATQD